MKKLHVFVLLLLAFVFTGCVNKHGVSLKYYSDCKEYYDYDGYYHKECGEDDIVTYEEIKKPFKTDDKDKNSIEGIPSNF